MVYCGKPSKGCQMCKTRRIKCDEARPFCNQCTKSRRECPGYKDPFDLVFRNETQATERRARKATAKAASLKTSGKEIEFQIITGAPSSSHSSQTTPTSSITTSPTQTVAERARCHFISNFILIPPQGTERGYFEFVVPILNNDPPVPFKLAFEACSLASLGLRVGHGREFEKQALSKYTAALAAVSGAIRDPIESKWDATVAAVLLLGLFENITARHVGMLAWGTHTEGAIQLVKGRGREQFQTKIGRDLFTCVRTQMLIFAFSSGKPLPLGAEFWIRGAAKDKFATVCYHITMRTSELKTEANRLLMTLDRKPENIGIIMDIIKKCQMRDNEFVQWSKNLPEYFDAKTTLWEDNVPNGDFRKAEVYPGRVDAFVDMWVATIWNSMRCGRIVLASIIVRCAAWVCYPVDYRTTPEYATYSRISAELITDIIASIPFCLGWFASRKHLLDKNDLTGYACGEDDAPKGLAGYLVTWPLSCVLTQDYSTDNQRAWVQGRLEAISSQLGMRCAKMLTHMHLRVPSMLIQRDIMSETGMTSSTVDLDKILASRAVPPSGLSVSPSAQRATVPVVKQGTFH